MKKLILVFGLAFSTLAFAASGNIQNQTEVSTATTEVASQLQDQKTDNESKEITCVHVIYDCGAETLQCGSSTLEIVMDAWNNYDLVCG